jgi:exopolyphosphatase/guanosine-5'-triphosphate,3'-diphosphate pyrophosphatase
VLALRLAVIFMHARIEGSLQQVGLRIRSRIELEIPRDWLVAHPTLSFWLDKERDYWKEVGTDFQVRLAG